MPPINFIILPQAPWWYSYCPGQNQWGEPDVLARLIIALARFHRRTGIAAGIGDISLRYGGPMPGHSTHQTGDRIDIRPIRIDRIHKPVSWTYSVSEYDHSATKMLCYYLMEEGAMSILFNDLRIIEEIDGVQPYEGHDNHLHVRYPRT